MTDIDDLKMLLPFYVNGTLGAEDCARIDAGLTLSAELRNELDELNGLAQSVREGGHSMIQGEDRVEEQLQALLNDPRVAEAPAAQAAPLAFASPVPPQGLLAFLNPKNWHPAVSLALAAAAVAQAGLVMGLSGEQQAGEAQIAKLEKRVGDLEFQLASGPGGGAAQPDILVQVKPDASWAALSELLAAEGLTIVDGPSDNTLSLSSELEGTALDAVIARLKASGLIATADKAA
jgi:hypothetical protein